MGGGEGEGVGRVPADVVSADAILNISKVNGLNQNTSLKFYHRFSRRLSVCVCGSV